ncbi:heme biosynthesis protein HemY [Thalassovita sp.]|uniref:heme biosynthesis protein HemY n=1 Tax=Thalassovita sp. TaxID=1979401 RepID=UPI002880FF31|nr:heme biosynthesis HemY N-terminal domain-containing protein [Thalassovita sp.]MDF1802139.1 heme biosynthesis HemY N-terminal domain-containing protein [Thalassovita sp.]
MLWSLIKIVVFVALVAAATLGAGYLLELEGGVRVAVGGIELNLTPLTAVIALLVLVLAIWLLLKLASLTIAVLKFLNGDETALSRYFDRNRERKGYKALTEGMMALASGEARLAMSKAARAEKYLGKPELTNLLTAQAAEMSGDRKKAEESYKKLLTDEKTRFVGVRGIMKQKLADGDADTARKLAEKAITLRPKHVETQDVLLKLQAQARDWSGARNTLNIKLKQGSLPRDVHKRRDAVLALSQAKGILDEGNDIAAREIAIEANRLSPDLIPAACYAARSYIEQGKPKLATRILKKAWDAQPHPDLAAVFAAIVPDEAPADRLKRFYQLFKYHPDHRETRLIQAELLIATEDFPAARRALADLLEENPDSRALTIMAAVERGEGASDRVVKGWLARALNAPRGPQWICKNCHNIHSEWGPVCENCQAFDTLEWSVPATSEVGSVTGVAMLPLIVGALEDQSQDDAEEEQVEDAAIPVVDAEIVEDEVEAPDEPKAEALQEEK